MKGARSVHLWWDVQNPVTEVKATVAVDESVPGSYFCACGFAGGYMGIQELTPNQDLGVTKIAIFSVWDSDKGMVKIVDKGENVTARRFGGEGTGAQALMPFDWKIGEICSCIVQATSKGPATTYKGFLKGSAGDWIYVATFEVEVDGRLIQGIYSFVEDFLRSEFSQQQRRRARYVVECRFNNQPPTRICRATFSADDNPATNINASVEGPWISLATGGDVSQQVPLGSTLQSQC